MISLLKITGKCDSGQFQCASGLCIPFDRYCDASVDCDDGSDELENCERNQKCRPDQFQCNLTRICLSKGNLKFIFNFFCFSQKSTILYEQVGLVTKNPIVVFIQNWVRIPRMKIRNSVRKVSSVNGTKQLAAKV